jgi:hypothetical protein
MTPVPETVHRAHPVDSNLVGENQSPIDRSSKVDDQVREGIEDIRDEAVDWTGRSHDSFLLQRGPTICQARRKRDLDVLRAPYQSDPHPSRFE